VSLRLVQRGQGTVRPLVLGFLVGGNVDAALRKAFGPDACILADGAAQGQMLAELVAFARQHAGLEGVSRLALIGYSAGCQRVRALYRAGVRADAYLLVDGTHASLPPEDWQIAWLRELAAEAKTGRNLVVATHTLQTYVERLKAPYVPYSSTLRVLRLATGFDLDDAGPLDVPLVTRQGELWVYSFASAQADAPAHAAQHNVALPLLATRHLGPWLARPSSAQPTKMDAASSTGMGLALLVLAGVLLTGKR